MSLSVSKVLCFIGLVAIVFLIFIPLKLLPKILANASDICVNIVMLIYITITISITHNIYDSIYAASTYDSVNIAMAIKQFANELLMLLRKYEYFMDKNTL